MPQSPMNVGEAAFKRPHSFGERSTSATTRPLWPVVANAAELESGRLMPPQEEGWTNVVQLGRAT